MQLSELESVYDPAKQIEVWEDASFLLTEEGRLFSWGRNENNFLARAHALDVKPLGNNDKRNKLLFSNFTPGPVTKLDKYFFILIIIKLKYKFPTHIN